MPYMRSLLVLLIGTAVSLADHEVRTLNNKSIRGKITAITAKEIHILDAEGKQEKVPLTQVLAVTLRPARNVPAGTKFHMLQLQDDSQLYCQSVAFKGNNVNAVLLSGQKFVIPMSGVTGFLRDAHDKKLRAQYEKNLKSTTKSDRVMVLRNGQLNPIPGAIGDVSPDGEKIQFRLSGVIKNVTISKLHGIIWHRLKGSYETPACLVVDTMGNRLAAKSVKVEGDTFHIVMPSGNKIAFAEQNLAMLDYNRGKLTFLSDMTPATVIERSAIGLIVRYHKDENLEGQPIYLGKVHHAKGLSMHAHTELEYDLKGKYKDFKAFLGADNRIGGESKAIVIIRCDGVQVYRASVDKLNDPAISLNIRNVARLRIIVQSSNLLDLHDHATLADARVIQ